MVVTMTMMAVPAKRGMWKTLKLTDGTEVKATLVGDEHGHYWMGTDGKAYQQSGEFYKTVDAMAVAKKANIRRMKTNQIRAQRMKKAKSSRAAQNSIFTDTKKGIIILVNFKDKSFDSNHTKSKYQEIANKENYSEGNFKGSMRDYFVAQSGGKFILDFDVVGPFTLSNDYSHYGKNDANGNDEHPADMVIEAVEKAMNEVEDWTPYDWDRDGYVDQVYVVYAGYGEADYAGAPNIIWPHAATLQELKDYGDGSGPVSVGTNLFVNTYACGSELSGTTGEIDGIGTMCHEFSHCMGFPDFYDTSYSGWYGMGNWDLMCGGSYNGDGFCPAGYTAYEKMECGWLEPTVLNEDVEVTGLEPTSEGGKAYILYNSGNANEYYVIENRQKTGWDKELPGKGLMITHIDYDQDLWEENTPNTKVTTADVREYARYGITIHANDHQRCTIFHADNDDDSKYWDSWNQYYTKMTEDKDLYPYKTNNSLTATSTPNASLYNRNAVGTKLMEKGITEITQNSNGSMSFKFGKPGSQGGDDPVTPVGDYLFYESFNDCSGKGGNDGDWSSSVASSAFVPDNEGWEAEAVYGGYQCARFGSSKKSGVATTPAFTVSKESQLTFKAAAWGLDGTSLKLSAEGSTVTITPDEFTMTSSKWQEFAATISGSGTIRLVFTPAKRFFLDEVLVTDPMTTGIQTAPVRNAREGSIYTLDGRFVGTDFNALSRGLYIVNGKKIVR